MDFRAYEATPGISVVVQPQDAAYTVVAVSNDFLALSGRRREDLIGIDYLDFFHKNSHDPYLTGEADLNASFDYVVKHRAQHQLSIRTYGTRAADGHVSVRHWNVRNVPICDDSGSVLFIIHAAVDVTDLVETENKVESVKGMEKAYKFFMQAPVIIGFLRGDNYQIELANEGLLKVWNRTERIIGRPLFEEFPELETQGIRKLLDHVRSTGKPFFAHEFPLAFDVHGRQETKYFDFIYHAYYENDNDKIATGIISIGHDVTDRVLAKEKFRNVIEQTHNPILILKGDDMILDAANKAMFEVWQVDESVLGKPLLEVRPTLKGQGFLERLQNVYRTGQPYQGFGSPVTIQDENGQSRTTYYNYTYQPYRDAKGETIGVMILGSDATEEVMSRKQLEESQRVWKQLADTMPTIVWTADPTGSIIFFNQRWYEYTGLSEEASLKFGWTDVLHPDDRARCLKLWNEALRTESFYEMEARYRYSDGQYRWVIARGVPIKEDGKVVAWYGNSTDINEHKQLELHLEDKVRERTGELDAKSKLLDNILAHSSNGISVTEMIYDESGKIVDATTILANDAAVRFSGIPREMYLSMRATAFDPEIMKSPYGQACMKTLSTGEPTIMQYYVEFSARWLELTVSRMDESHLIHIFTDVTPIKKAHLELEKSLEDLKFANANLQEFAYAASHDLKEPVRKIQFFSSRLREELKERIDEQSANLLSRLQKSAGRMEKLIDDLLEYSHVARGSAVSEEVDLGAKVQSVLEDLELEISKKQARIELGSLPVIQGNARQLQQLFQNLISNALKYSRPGETPRIKIRSEQLKGKDAMPDLPLEAPDRNYHLLEVSDNGIGFRRDDAEKIFNLFTRLDSGIDSRGSGLGLSIVKKVVESHHGFVWAESDVGKGSTFKILLPV